MRRHVSRALLLVLAVVSLSCGYNLTSKGSNLPAHIKRIGVPEFENDTTRPELGQRITEKIIEELVGRAKYTVTTESRGVDGVLRGRVVDWTSRPVQRSDEGGEAERVSVTLRASVRFYDRVQDRATWQQENYQFTREYQVVGDPEEYFDTELDAVDEVAADFARAVVSAILQGF